MTSSPLAAMLARRAGRTVFGLGLLAGVVALVSGAIRHGHVSDGGELHAMRILAIAWASATAAGVIAWQVARRVAHTWQPDALRYAGLVTPTIGLALIAPLSVHALVAIPLGMNSDGFDEWVTLSLVMAGIAHLMFAGLATLRVVALVDGSRPLAVGWVYLIVVLTACLPFVVFVLPPVIVALTGIPMLPILYAPEAIVARERVIADTTPALAYVCMR